MATTRLEMGVEDLPQLPLISTSVVKKLDKISEEIRSRQNPEEKPREEWMEEVTEIFHALQKEAVLAADLRARRRKIEAACQRRGHIRKEDSHICKFCGYWMGVKITNTVSQ